MTNHRAAMHAKCSAQNLRSPLRVDADRYLMRSRCMLSCFCRKTHSCWPADLSSLTVYCPLILGNVRSGRDVTFSNLSTEFFVFLKCSCFNNFQLITCYSNRKMVFSYQRRKRLYALHILANYLIWHTAVEWCRTTVMIPIFDATYWFQEQSDIWYFYWNCRYNEFLQACESNRNL